MGRVGRQLVRDMGELTLNRFGSEIMANARRNSELVGTFGQSLSALRGESLNKADSAIVIAAGPSVKRFDPIKQVIAAGYKGAVIATESAINYCLTNGVVPDLIVTLDPHATRIVRWFGDPDLSDQRIGDDDYYRRQDMDPAFADEKRNNEILLELVNAHGGEMRIALSTSTSAAVVDRVLQTGMEIYWWNPMMDDPDRDGLSRELQALNGLPCVNAGGNVGSACWMMADAVLNKNRVALTGMDFSYYEGTSYVNTQYYHDAVNLVGAENLDDIFMPVHNPHIDTWFYTDPAYMWYRECFLEMVGEAECQTYNCTEGGILFGPDIEFVPLAQFLDEEVGRGAATTGSN